MGWNVSVSKPIGEVVLNWPRAAGVALFWYHDEGDPRRSKTAPPVGWNHPDRGTKPSRMTSPDARLEDAESFTNVYAIGAASAHCGTISVAATRNAASTIRLMVLSEGIGKALGIALFSITGQWRGGKVVSDPEASKAIGAGSAPEASDGYARPSCVASYTLIVFINR